MPLFLSMRFTITLKAICVNDEVFCIDIISLCHFVYYESNLRVDLVASNFMKCL